MKGTLFALAAAAVLASGTAVAGGALHPVVHDRSAALVPVQYHAGYAAWDERSATINEREARINARIQRGIDNGSITRHEARQLYRQLRDIESRERAFRSDGRLDGREFAELNRNLDDLAANVREQRHDEQRRY
jgi:hypothetical protein